MENHAQSQVSARGTDEPSSAGGWAVEVAWLCVYRGRAAAVISVHPGVGVGGHGRLCARLRGMGVDWNLQEVKACA